MEAFGENRVWTGMGDWEWIERQSLEYVEEKNNSGSWSANHTGEVDVPLLDSLNGREIIG